MTLSVSDNLDSRMSRKERFVAGCKEQSRVVGALVMREIHTRFGRDNIGFAWIIMEPIMFCLGVIAMWSVLKSESHIETPIVPFLLSGYMPLLLYRHCVMRALRCMQANLELMYHRQVTIFAMYMARMAVEIVGTLAAFFITGFIFFMWGFVEKPYDMGPIIIGWLLYAWYSVAVAILIGALSERSEVVEKIWHPISYIMIPLSGAFYMVDWLPKSVHHLIVLFPQVSAVEYLRGGYFGPSVPVYHNLPVAIYVTAVLTVLGLYFLKDARSYVEVT
ncbi:capsular polysaccharide transport system permease protein [Roseibium hamelinense]|uniref:Capsular polysaccharide transport system permease protein n=1 Tax=Roseibium hamelinense TaxID=150831 RepID=A0A562T193_9HYPH|nr:ABC transporter permease [Roseibium hamelinense]MTI44441.1 ABC transporter permease [Roseibium hamelinense]TWI87407.1 capsular polysaccharide transport system permease protein [Roseibium hamelinense]